MRKTFVLLLTLLCYTAYAQISTRELPSSTPEAPKPVVFDSLDGLVRYKKIQRYLGQEIFFIPKQLAAEAKNTYSGGYANIYTQLPTGYKSQSTKNTYKPITEDDNTSTLYSAVAGKYFTVLEVIDKTENSYSNGNGLFLKLEAKDTKDVVYLDIKNYIDNDQYRSAEYIIAGTFIKLQQLYLNQTFYLKYNLDEPLKEINTGELIKQKAGDEWHCTDVTLMPQTEGYVYQPSVIFKNKVGQEVAYVLSLDINMGELSERYMSKAERQKIDKQQAVEDSLNAIRAKELKAKNDKEYAEDKATYIKKYGEKYGKLIADGNVAIGMNKEMCVAAWGRPTTVNTTTNSYGTRDQYVYRDKNAYLYFENGKLTSIQK